MTMAHSSGGSGEAAEAAEGQCARMECAIVANGTLPRGELGDFRRLQGACVAQLPARRSAIGNDGTRRHYDNGH